MQKQYIKALRPKTKDDEQEGRLLYLILENVIFRGTSDGGYEDISLAEDEVQDKGR